MSTRTPGQGRVLSRDPGRVARVALSAFAPQCPCGNAQRSPKGREGRVVRIRVSFGQGREGHYFRFPLTYAREARIKDLSEHAALATLRDPSRPFATLTVGSR